MTDITPLSGDELNKLVDDFEASEHNRMAMNAVTAAGIDKVARNYDHARLMQRRFSTVVDNGTVTHQDLFRPLLAVQLAERGPFRGQAEHGS